MNTIFSLTLSAALVFSGTATADVSSERISGAQYVKTQLTLLSGITEMLNIPNIADGPDETADGIRQLVAYLRSLAACKAEIPSEELAKAEASANKNKQTHIAGQAFLAAIHKTSNNNFYNSRKLAEIIRELSKVLEQL